jgi:hypothetical protein
MPLSRVELVQCSEKYYSSPNYICRPIDRTLVTSLVSSPKRSQRNRHYNMISNAAATTLYKCRFKHYVKPSHVALAALYTRSLSLIVVGKSIGRRGSMGVASAMRMLGSRPISGKTGAALDRRPKTGWLKRCSGARSWTGEV